MVLLIGDDLQVIPGQSAEPQVLVNTEIVVEPRLCASLKAIIYKSGALAISLPNGVYLLGERQYSENLDPS